MFIVYYQHVRIQKVLSEGVQLDRFFWLMRGELLVAGHHRPARETPFKCRWHADDGPTLNAGSVAVIFRWIRASIAKKSYIFVIFQGGIRTSIANKHYIFVIFQGGGGVQTPCPPSGSAHEMYKKFLSLNKKCYAMP